MGQDTERARVQTYVPTYQKDVWVEHAERLGMSQSEFVRTMVQAGRRKFEVPALESETDAETGSHERGRNGANDDAGRDGLEPHVLEVLSTEEFRSWDELIEEVTGGIEDHLDDTLQRLQSRNRVQFSGRHGGYTLVEGSDGD